MLSVRARTTIDPHCAVEYVSVIESCHSSTISYWGCGKLLLLTVIGKQLAGYWGWGVEVGLGL